MPKTKTTEQPQEEVKEKPKASSTKKNNTEPDPVIKVKVDKKGKTYVTTGKMMTGWTCLDTPSTKYKPEGEFSVKLIADSKSEEAKQLIAIIDEVYDESVEDAKRELKKAKVKMAERPYSEEEDEDGNPTGNMVFRFSMLHKKQIKDKETGKVVKVIEQRPAVFSADCKPFPLNKAIMGGSIVKVNGLLSKFYVPATGAGVSLKLIGAQILQLSERTVTAEGCGFEEEDGYSPEADETAITDETTGFESEADDSDGDEDEGDF